MQLDVILTMGVEEAGIKDSPKEEEEEKCRYDDGAQKHPPAPIIPRRIAVIRLAILIGTSSHSKGMSVLA